MCFTANLSSTVCHTLTRQALSRNKQRCHLLFVWCVLTAVFPERAVCSCRTGKSVLCAHESSVSANEEEIQFLTHPRLQSVPSSLLLAARFCITPWKSRLSGTARKLKSLHSKIMRHFKLGPLAQQKGTYANINFRHEKIIEWVGLGWEGL